MSHVFELCITKFARKKTFKFQIVTEQTLIFISLNIQVKTVKKVDGRLQMQ
jgi:hypothetical protein